MLPAQQGQIWGPGSTDHVNLRTHPCVVPELQGSTAARRGDSLPQSRAQAAGLGSGWQSKTREGVTSRTMFFWTEPERANTQSEGQNKGP